MPDVRETFFFFIYYFFFILFCLFIYFIFFFFADSFTGSKDTEPYKTDVSFCVSIL